MLRRACLGFVVLAALAAAPAAAGDGPMFVLQDGAGVLSANGAVRHVAVASGANTLLETIQTRDGVLRSSQKILGSWGFPYLFNASAGLSHDGRTLVLESMPYGSPTKFLVLDAQTLRIRNWAILNGTYSFDALSPDAKRLYLIQYTQAKYNDLSHYVVRAYDFAQNRLLPGRIADRTQRSWVMDGYPVTRVTSADGRWDYTLYGNPGGFPFIHALDTVRGVAHCVGLPLQDQNGLYNLVLSLRGRTLAVHWRSGRRFVDVSTATWRVTPDRGSPFPWLLVVVVGGAAGAAALAALAAFLFRRRSREEFEQELVHLLGHAEREVMV
jgi:hypothetical protein